jgi:hypothetical protein
VDEEASRRRGAACPEKKIIGKISKTSITSCPSALVFIIIVFIGDGHGACFTLFSTDVMTLFSFIFYDHFDIVV